MTLPRREFLLLGTLGLVGCAKSKQKPLVIGGTNARSATSHVRQTELLQQLSKYKVPANASRTTPSAPTSVGEKLPQMRGLKKTCIRLHPRLSVPSTSDSSKIGGLFLWPEAESWPTNTAGEPLDPIIQLRAEDLGPQVQFPEQINLLQVFWDSSGNVTASNLKPIVFWRNTKEIRSPKTNPAQLESLTDHTPFECRLFPELVDEYPPLSLLPTRIVEEVQALPNYDAQLSTCPGTKVGGYPYGLTKETNTACTKCKRPMDFLLAISGADWPGETDTRWQPKEEANATGEELKAYREATGLKFTENAATNRVNVFVCRRCQGWPIRIVE